MINKTYDQKIQAWIQENRERLISMWLDLVRIPSVKSAPAPGAPYGIACAQALKKAADYAQEMGFETRLEADRGYALASYGNGEKTIGIFGHSDVVPAGDGWIYCEPFDPIIRDGVVFGRGCADNKSGVMAALFVAQLIRDCQLPLKSRLQVFVGSHEESGMKDMESFVEHEKMPDLSIVPDAAYPCSLGEKGHLKQWNQCNIPLEDILDIYGEGAFNIVLDNLKVTIKNTPERMAELTEKVKGNPAVTLGETAEGHILLTAKGASKHSAYPDGSVNAALAAFTVLADCATISQSDRNQLATFLHFFADYYGTNQGIAFEEPGFGKLTCTNGMIKVEGGKLCVSVDIRYGAGMPGTKLEAMLDKTWQDAGWKTTFRENHHGAKVDPDSPIPALLTDICCEITGAHYEPYWMPGGTYSRHLKNSFTVGSRIADPNSKAVIPEMPSGHGSPHQRDEYCTIDSYLLGIRVLAHYVLACDQAINP